MSNIGTLRSHLDRNRKYEFFYGIMISWTSYIDVQIISFICPQSLSLPVSSTHSLKLHRSGSWLNFLTVLQKVL